MKDIQSQFKVGDGVNTEIPCVACEHGLYERHCICHPGEAAYVVLTCDQCGEWMYHDSYISGRVTVAEFVGKDRCIWRTCSVTGLRYMTTLSHREGFAKSYWDRVCERMIHAGDRVLALKALVVEASAHVGAFYDPAHLIGWDADALRYELEHWIDLNS